MYFNNKLIAATETTKAVIIPVTRIASSILLKSRPNLYSFKALAPNIMGIDKKKENSAAINLEVPRIIPPRIVAPDLEVPGIKDKT